MEKIFDIIEEIEAKGDKILTEGKLKAQEILDLAKQKIQTMEKHEIEKAKKEINEIYVTFQKDLNKQIDDLVAEKDRKVQSIKGTSIKTINIDEILGEIIKL